jgi:ABC-type multidrug transport system fused ATPase/permease subunit
MTDGNSGKPYVLVLSNGEVVEFDETKTLLSKKDSLFYNLYMKSH